MLCPSERSDDPRGGTGDAPARSTVSDAVPAQRGLMAALAQGWRELCWLLLLLLLSGWAALQQTGLPARTRPPNPPVPFFVGGGHLVDDFYQGRLDGVRLSYHDVSVLFYYAPWDRDSMRARETLASLSRKWHRQIYFAAINCWWPEGECRRAYRPSSFPAVGVHVRGFGHLLYRGSLWPPWSLEQFLGHVARPLTYLTTAEEMRSLLQVHSAVVVAVLEEGLPPDAGRYEAMYAVAVNALAKDPLREVAFAIVTNAGTARRLCLQDPLTMHSWNSSLSYDGDWLDTDKVVSWIYENLHLTVRWLSPSGVKSLALSQVVQNASTLILFAPRPSWEYGILQEIAREYHSCGPGVLWGLGSPLRGLGCGGNGTLRFLAMDANTYAQFVPPGALVPGMQRSVAIIYSDTEEQEYVLEGPVSRASLQHFVQDFTAGYLRRHLRSEQLPECEPGTLVCRLSSVTFRRLVLADASRDVVALFCASWCGFCKGILHHLQAAARFFDGVAGIVFASIDASKNDLPWQFTMDRYPAILFFPARRRSESSVYRERPVSELGLVEFVLGRAQPQVVLAGALALCSRSRACLLRNLAQVAHRALCLPSAPWAVKREALKKARRARNGLISALQRHRAGGATRP